VEGRQGKSWKRAYEQKRGCLCLCERRKWRERAQECAWDEQHTAVPSATSRCTLFTPHQSWLLHTNTHTNTYAHAHAETHMHTHIRMYPHGCLHKHMHARMHELKYNTLQDTATHCFTMKQNATYCTTLQHTSTHRVGKALNDWSRKIELFKGCLQQRQLPHTVSANHVCVCVFVCVCVCVCLCV